MTSRKLKSIVPPPDSPEGGGAAPQASSRLQAARLREIAEEMAQSLPPAVVSSRRTSTLINLRVDASLADWLSDRARAEGTTQKVIITRALAAAGAPVSPLDLTDRTPRRRRS
jgi:hypothetical protein